VWKEELQMRVRQRESLVCGGGGRRCSNMSTERICSCIDLPLSFHHGSSNLKEEKGLWKPLDVDGWMDEF